MAKIELQWHQADGEACASSCMHDDGSCFQYLFAKRPDGWHNLSDAELITGPHLAVYRTLESAKAWASGVEDRWLRSVTTTNARFRPDAPEPIEESEHE